MLASTAGARRFSSPGPVLPGGGEKAENEALASGIAPSRVEGADRRCRAAPTVQACTAALDAGQQVVDAEDRYDAASTDEENDVAFDQQQAALTLLSTAVASCGR